MSTVVKKTLPLLYYTSTFYNIIMLKLYWYRKAVRATLVLVPLVSIVIFQRYRSYLITIDFLVRPPFRCDNLSPFKGRMWVDWILSLRKRAAGWTSGMFGCDNILLRKRRSKWKKIHHLFLWFLFSSTKQALYPTKVVLIFIYSYHSWIMSLIFPFRCFKILRFITWSSAHTDVSKRTTVSGQPEIIETDFKAEGRIAEADQEELVVQFS